MEPLDLLNEKGTLFNNRGNDNQETLDDLGLK